MREATPVPAAWVRARALPWLCGCTHHKRTNISETSFKICGTVFQYFLSKEDSETAERTQQLRPSWVLLADSHLRGSACGLPIPERMGWFAGPRPQADHSSGSDAPSTLQSSPQKALQTHCWPFYNLPSLRPQASH